MFPMIEEMAVVHEQRTTRHPSRLTQAADSRGTPGSQARERAKYGGNAANRWRVALLPATLWVTLWLSINSGPWVLAQEPDSVLGWLHYGRTLFPAVVLLAVAMVGLKGRSNAPLPGVTKLWLFYGTIGLGASVMAPDIFGTAYWGVCYLSAFAVLWLYLQQPGSAARIVGMNYLSWLAATVFVLILLAVARDQLWEQAASGESAYGIIGQVPTVAGMAMSRSSGMARFLAVPALVSLVYAFSRQGLARFFWIGAAISSSALLVFFQSRGALADTPLGRCLLSRLWDECRERRSPSW